MHQAQASLSRGCRRKLGIQHSTTRGALGTARTIIGPRARLGPRRPLPRRGIFFPDPAICASFSFPYSTSFFPLSLSPLAPQVGNPPSGTTRSDKEPVTQWKLADWLSRSTGLGPLMLLEWRKLRSGVRVAPDDRIVDYDESSVRVLAPSHVPRANCSVNA
jgi:hypothetical protein